MLPNRSLTKVTKDMHRIIRTFIILASFASVVAHGQVITAGDSSDLVKFQFVEDWGYNEIQNEFISGGAFEGFRHARVDEAFFIFQAFYGYSMAGSGEQNFLPVYSIMNDIGGDPFSTGGSTILSTSWLNVEGGGTFSFQVQRDQGSQASSAFSGNIDYTPAQFMSFSSFSTAQIQPTAGQFLIKYETLANPVPEPAQIAVLMLLGLGGMLIIRRRFQTREKA